MLSVWSRQVSSYRDPILPPTVDPDNPGSLVCVQIAAEWLPYIAGALSQLRQQSTWLGTDSEQLLAIQRSTDLIAMICLAGACVPCPTDGASELEDSSEITD